jgi:hypothetical protein
MKAILLVLASGLVALGLITAALFIGGDRDIFTSPPEAVAENFIRSLAMRRFGGPAQRALAEDLQKHAAERLRALSREIARPDALLGVDAHEVTGQHTRRSGRDEAEVVVRVRRVGGDDMLATVPLQQSSSHAWQITRLDWHFRRP